MSVCVCAHVCACMRACVCMRTRLYVCAELVKKEMSVYRPNFATKLDLGKSAIDTKTPSNLLTKVYVK